MDVNDRRMRNLVSNSERTAEKRKEIARMGGKASGVSRKAHKAMRETLLEMLSMPMRKGRTAGKLTAMEELKGANLTLRERILAGIALKAAKGDVKAAAFVRDTIGEMPVQEVKLEQSAVARLSDDELRRIANGEA